MLIIGSRLIRQPILGLQTGGELARTVNPIIDPAQLTIVGYEVASPLLKGPCYLRVEDVRELGDMGFIIDALDELVQPGDVIKLDGLVELGFPLIGMPVRDEKRRKVGKVTDYTVDLDTFTVQQLTVRRPLLKSLNDSELVIHRSQIIEINNDSIVINSEAEIPEHTRLTAPGSYVNPFRESRPVADSSDLRQS